jgi:hypothetical protein
MFDYIPIHSELYSGKYVELHQKWDEVKGIKKEPKKNKNVKGKKNYFSVLKINSFFFIPVSTCVLFQTNGSKM